MIRWFDNLNIRWKLAFISAVTTVAALMTSGTLIGVREQQTYESQQVDQFTSEARITAANLTAAVAFGDSNAARQILSGLLTNPQTDSGAVYGADNALLASSSRQEGKLYDPPDKPPPLGHRLAQGRVSVAVPITQGNEQIGSVYLAGHVEPASARIYRQALISIFNGIVALSLILPVSMRLHRTVTNPVEELAAAKARAEEADHAKSLFLAAMSHEIRTPMNGVLGLIELLHTTPLSNDQRQMLEIIHQSGTGLLDVINDILDYSKIEAGRMTVEDIEFSLGEVVEASVKVIGGHTKSKTLNISCIVDPAIDWVVRGDSVRLRQVILNLLGNALKFTEVGSVEIECKSEEITPDRVMVLFEVRDTGIGMEEDKLTRLFERFSQADYSTTRRYGGTGLGLSISKNLVELMGGEIGVRSKLGEGSTFWFRIPFHRVPPARRVDPFESCRESLAGLRVLVCSRRAHFAAATAYLRAVGVSVVEATSVSQAVDVLYQEDIAHRQIDLVILNVYLGEDNVSLFLDQIEQRKSFDKLKLLVILPAVSASAAARMSRRDLDSSLYAPYARLEFYQAVASRLGLALPDAPRRDEIAALNFVPPTVEQARKHGCLVLIAEDNKTNQFVIATQMNRLGYATEMASDGREAWELLKEDNRYGLLLSDCHMPFVDGYQLTGMIRAREQGTGVHLPVVALTANALEGEAELCLAAGMDDYLSKPAKLADLDRVLQKWLPSASSLRTVRLEPGLQPSSAQAENDRVTPKSAAPIDVAELAAFLGSSDPGYLREVMGSFWQSMVDTQAALRKTIQHKDLGELTKVAHSAKGAAASACATRLAYLFRELETAARGGEWEVIEGISPKIDNAYEDIKQFVDANRQT